MTEVGQSTLALGALKAVANGLLAEITGAAKGVAKRSIGKLQAEFGIGFAQYVERNKKRCGLVKTLLHRVDPIPINNAYVDPAFELQRRELLGENFAESLTELKNIIIVGSGGAGKSIFIKRLFLSFCENPFGRIPIFVELRDLNQKDSRDLFVHIYRQWSELIPSLTKEALDCGLRAGKFVLLLDGLDEVNREIRDDVVT